MTYIVRRGKPNLQAFTLPGSGRGGHSLSRGCNLRVHACPMDVERYPRVLEWRVDVSDPTSTTRRETATDTETLSVAEFEVGKTSVRRFRITVVEGAAREMVWESAADRCSIGSHASNDLVIDDPTVSRFHCEIRIDQDGTRVRDLDSRNGTVLDGVRVIEGFLRGNSVLRLGQSTLRFEFGQDRNLLPVSAEPRFGSLVGVSIGMRTAFGMMQRAAQSDATVLLEGETGTGKEGAAESIHRASERRDGPFVVVDCSAIPRELIESELFGHEKGAFTGAVGRRIGAFEEASGGTIFLDEVGELTPELQPKLLRVLEQREVRRVGTNIPVPADVRVVAATNRDLRAEVNDGRFRSDLYFRLAVVRIPLPPLRTRPEDIPLLVEDILSRLPARPEVAKRLRTAEFSAALQRATWPGNVRELRNCIERCLVFEEPIGVGDGPSQEIAPAGATIDSSMSYEEGRRRALADFQRRYVEALLETHEGRIAQAARAAGIDRVYLHRLIRRYGLRR
jgi:two-component system, NtrC family, response regulator GlrR